MNGASDLMVEVFGDKGRHARSAVGMGSLPEFPGPFPGYTGAWPRTCTPWPRVLRDNPLGDPHIRNLAVWLPPGYDRGVAGQIAGIVHEAFVWAARHNLGLLEGDELVGAYGSR